MPLQRLFVLFTLLLPVLSFAQSFDNCEELFQRRPYLTRAVSISPTDDSLLYDSKVLQHCFDADSIDKQLLDPMTTASLALEVFDWENWSYPEMWDAFLRYKKTDEYKENRLKLETIPVNISLNEEAEIYHFPENGSEFKELMTWEEAIEQAKKEQKPLLIYFTAYACIQCRKQEMTILSDPTVQSVIRSDYLAFAAYCDDKKLLSDGKTQKGKKNMQVQLKQFENTSQPAFYIVSPEGKLLDAVYYFPYPEEFLNFLRQ